MSSTLEQLVEMGFNRVRVEKALLSTENNGLQPAIEWLCAHQDDPDIDVPLSVASTSIEPPNLGDQNIVAKSLKCDDCGKLFSNETLVQLHSAKTGHVNFSESVDEIKPLTEEEKRIQMQKLQEKMKQKREEREKQEEDENLKRERIRRHQGKSIIDSKIKFEEDEIRKLAEEKRREKEEDKLYRQRLKDQIARDREDRKVPPAASATVQPSPLKPLEASRAPSDSTTCRIQIRGPNGQPIVETFAADDCLSVVAAAYAKRTQLAADRQAEVLFRTTMPPRLYGRESMALSLRQLGFCPSIVLMAVLQATAN